MTGDPVRWFDAIRDRSPLVRHSPTDAWLVTRFDGVQRLLRDERLSSARPTPVQARSVPADLATRIHRVAEGFYLRWPMFCDGPHHQVLRGLMRPLSQAPLVSEAVLATERTLRSYPLPDPGEDGFFDAAVIRPLVAGASAALRIGDHPWPAVSECSRDIIRLLSRFREADGPTVAAAERAIAQLGLLLETSAGALAGELSAGCARGVICQADALACYGQSVTGFVEPTAVAAAMALRILATAERAREVFDTDRGKWVDEAIRLATPFHYAPRVVNAEMIVHNQRLLPGDRVMLTLVSANRDPRRFHEPERFRPGRAAHLSFGRGPHACPGRRVAGRLIEQIVGQVLATVPLARLSRFDPGWAYRFGMRSVHHRIA